MAQTIKLKNSGTSSNTPSSLEHGELAINYADGKIFYKNSGNSIVEFTTTSGSFLPLSGGTLTGNLSLGDNVKLQLGNQTNGDLQIYHDGNNSYIKDAGTGNLNIQANQLRIQSDTGENFIECVPNAQVVLRFDNNVKLQTTSTGISITSNANFPDNGKAIFGAGNDLQIYHDGSDSYVADRGTGNLRLEGTNIALNNQGSNKTYLLATDGGSVQLRHNDVAKLETTSTGISISNDANFPDNGKAIFGAGNDLQIYHDGSASYIKENGTGDLIIQGSNTMRLQGSSNQELANFSTGGAVTLFHNGSAKLATTSTGIDVTGTVEADGLTVTDGNLITTKTGNGEVIRFGRSTDNFRFSSIFHNSSDAGQAFIDFKVHDGSTANSQLQVLSLKGTGNVNIPNGSLMIGATTAPDDKLHVSDGNIKITNTNSPAMFLLKDSRASATSEISQRSDGRLSIAAVTGSYGSTGIEILANGNVGLGTTSPNTATKLHVSVPQSGVASGTGITLSGWNGTAESRVQLMSFGIGDGTFAIRTGTSNLERVRIDSSGNLLVGTTSQISSGKISVAGGTNANGITATTSATSGFASASFQRTASDGQLIQFKKGSGEVGSIGTVAGDIVIGTGDCG